MSLTLPAYPMRNQDRNETIVDLRTNHYTFKLNQHAYINVYKVNVDPEISGDNRQLRVQIVRKCKEALERQIGFYAMCGENAYSPTFRAPEVHSPPKRDFEEEEYPALKKRLKPDPSENLPSEEMILEASDRSTPLK